MKPGTKKWNLADDVAMLRAAKGVFAAAKGYDQINFELIALEMGQDANPARVKNRLYNFRQVFAGKTYLHLTQDEVISRLTPAGVTIKEFLNWPIGTGKAFPNRKARATKEEKPAPKVEIPRELPKEYRLISGKASIPALIQLEVIVEDNRFAEKIRESLFEYMVGWEVGGGVLSYVKMELLDMDFAEARDVLLARTGNWAAGNG